MKRSKQKENGKDKTSMKLTDLWVKKKREMISRRENKEIHNRKKRKKKT